MPGLSIHVVDVARGQPAMGMHVEVYTLAPERRQLAAGDLSESGALEDAITGQRLEAGPYEVIFHAGAFFASAGVLQATPPFLDVVPFRFTIADPAQHYHLPMKMTPWGYSVFRGS